MKVGFNKEKKYRKYKRLSEEQKDMIYGTDLIALFINF